MTSIDFIFKHAKRQSQYTMFEIIVEIFFKICLYLLLIVVFLIVSAYYSIPFVAAIRVQTKEN